MGAATSAWLLCPRLGSPAKGASAAHRAIPPGRVESYAAAAVRAHLRRPAAVVRPEGAFAVERACRFRSPLTAPRRHTVVPAVGGGAVLLVDTAAHESFVAEVLRWAERV